MGNSSSVDVSDHNVSDQKVSDHNVSDRDHDVRRQRSQDVVSGVFAALDHSNFSCGSMWECSDMMDVDHQATGMTPMSTRRPSDAYANTQATRTRVVSGRIRRENMLHSPAPSPFPSPGQGSYAYHDGQDWDKYARVHGHPSGYHAHGPSHVESPSSQLGPEVVSVNGR
jgi:hypothetical protein